MEVFQKDNTDKEKDRFKLRFIHIPKTAGTSIENWGRKYGYKWGRFDPDTPVNVPGTHARAGYWHSPAKYWKISNGVQYFCVVRDPIDRFISAMNFHYKEYDQLDLNEFIHEKFTLDFIFSENCKSFLPQVHYVFNSDTDEQFCDFVLDYDYLETEFTRLMLTFRDYRAYRSLPKVNVSHKHKFSANMLSDKSLKILKEVYAEDYKFISLLKKFKEKYTFSSNDKKTVEDKHQPLLQEDLRHQSVRQEGAVEESEETVQ